MMAPDLPGFSDLLPAPWTARTALRGVWAASLRCPLGDELPHVLRVFLPGLEGLLYEGESGVLLLLRKGMLKLGVGCGCAALYARRRAADAHEKNTHAALNTPIHAGPTPGDLVAALQTVAACETQPRCFRLRALCLELAPTKHQLTLRVEAHAGEGNGDGDAAAAAEGEAVPPPCLLPVSLDCDQVWDAAAASALLAALPAFRRLQLLLVRCMAGPQEAALIREWRRLAGGAPTAARRAGGGWLRLARLPERNAARLADLEAALLPPRASSPRPDGAQQQQQQQQQQPVLLQALPKQYRPAPPPPQPDDAAPARDQGLAAPAATVWGPGGGGSGGSGDELEALPLPRPRAYHHAPSPGRAAAPPHARAAPIDRARPAPLAAAEQLARAPAAAAAAAATRGGAGARPHVPTLGDQLGLRGLAPPDGRSLEGVERLDGYGGGYGGCGGADYDDDYGDALDARPRPRGAPANPARRQRGHRAFLRPEEAGAAAPRRRPGMAREQARLTELWARDADAGAPGATVDPDALRRPRHQRQRHVDSSGDDNGWDSPPRAPPQRRAGGGGRERCAAPEALALAPEIDLGSQDTAAGGPRGSLDAYGVSDYDDDDFGGGGDGGGGEGYYAAGDRLGAAALAAARASLGGGRGGGGGGGAGVTGAPRLPGAAAPRQRRPGGGGGRGRGGGGGGGGWRRRGGGGGEVVDLAAVGGDIDLEMDEARYNEDDDEEEDAAEEGEEADGFIVSDDVSEEELRRGRFEAERRRRSGEQARERERERSVERLPALLSPLSAAERSEGERRPGEARQRSADEPAPPRPPSQQRRHDGPQRQQGQQQEQQQEQAQRPQDKEEKRKKKRRKKTWNEADDLQAWGWEDE